jgi:hypothetical protein
VADGSGFEIDPAGVKAFGSQLKSDVDKDIAPTSERIKQNLLWYPVFGERSGSPAVQAAATKYVEQMRAGITLLDNLIHNATVMAQAAEDAVAAYKLGDELSAADMQLVIGGAATKADRAAAEAEAARRKAEQEAAQADRDFRRELHQGGNR